MGGGGLFQAQGHPAKMALWDTTVPDMRLGEGVVWCKVKEVGVRPPNSHPGADPTCWGLTVGWSEIGKEQI